MMTSPSQPPGENNGQANRSDGDSAGDIRAQMARLRQGMSVEANQVRKKAKQAFQWRHYLRRYPLTSVGVAALAGFMVVPAKKCIIRPTKEQLEELIQEGKLRLRPTGLTDGSQKASVAQKAVLALGTIAARAAMAYLGKRIGDTTGTAASATSADEVEASE